MPKYVKLIAKPDTWFKAGTEVFDYDCFGKRITLEAYNEWLKSRSILVRGTRICQFSTELLIGSGYKLGEERIDGELCGINEFDVEVVEEERLIQTNQVDVMIEMAKDSDKLESENFIEKLNNTDMPKYVKLIAKPDTWFKAGTEAFDDDEYGKRITLESYNKWLKSGSILVRGIRVCEHDYELKLGYKLGEEREDGELCGIDEFDMTIVDEKDIPWPKPLDPPTTTAEAEARQRRFEDNIRYIQG
jgi:hypothetical protein